MRRIRMLCPLLFLFAGCSCTIVPSKSVDSRVSNGTAYDQATIILTPGQKVVLPQNARVTRDAPPGELRLYIRKTLDYFGHPGVPMSIEGQRDRIGCASKNEGSTLTLATFGEWDSHVEGGAFITLIVSLPPNVPFETQPNLSGEKSLCEDRADHPYYGVPGQFQPGWTKIHNRPDPNFWVRRYPVDPAP